MRLFRRKCAFLLDIFALTALFCLSVVAVHAFWTRHPRGSKEPVGQDIQLSFLAPLAPATAGIGVLEDGPKHSWKVDTAEKAKEASPNSLAKRGLEPPSIQPEGAAVCTMGRCFDTSKCSSDFRIYVYPDSDELLVSGLYRKFLRILRNSQYYTSDPDKACVLIPSWDTLDRDQLSDEYTQNLPSPLTLPHWNHGRNHLFFNLYSGSWPTYEESLDFPTGQAMVAKASFNTKYFRSGFDISLPLLHNSHPERGTFPSVMSTKGNTLPVRKKYHLAFKGKRYLYGLGIEPRRSLFHLHNNRDVVMVTTCRHNKNWEKFQDSRCNHDNALYNRYDYTDLLTNSTFCLVPRGRRLGSFRFIEALQATCIPISLSNGYVLPFHEVIDWSKSTITVDERHILQIPHFTRSIAMQKVLEMRSKGSWVYETYLSSVEKVVMTTIEIIKNRLRPSSSFVWNRPPGGLNFVPSFSPSLQDYPFYRHGNLNCTTNYTIVVSCSRPALKGGSPLIKVIKGLSRAPRLSKIFIIWGGVGPPKISLPSLPVTVTTIVRPALRLNPLSEFHSVHGLETDAILHLSEDTELTVDEAEFGMETWLSFPDRLVGYVAHSHSWDEETLKWTYSSSPSNKFSLVLSGAVFYHRYYSHALAHSLPQTLARVATTEPDCTNLVLNFFISHVTGKPPIKATHKQTLVAKATYTKESSTRSFAQSQIPCLNLLVTAFGYMPLKFSSVRMDPVLFKDSVSMLRKEYRTLDRL